MKIFKNCYGTDEFNRMSGICHTCELFKHCRKIKNKRHTIPIKMTLRRRYHERYGK